MSERGMVIGYPSRDDSLEGPTDPAEGAITGDSLSVDRFGSTVIWTSPEYRLLVPYIENTIE